MAAPFSKTTITSYNSNPPSDDGSATQSNQVFWSTIKSKLPDPIKTGFDSSEIATLTAFQKMPGGAGITSISSDYTVASSDQGNIVKVTAAANITTPDATAVGAPFLFFVLNISGGGITVKGNNPGVQQNIDGAVSFSLPTGCGVMLQTDGSNWFTGGQDFNGVTVQPQGRLTLTSGTPIISADVTGAVTVYYTPYVGALCPVYNGTGFANLSFSELSLTLQNSSTYAASTLFDIFAFNNSGLTIGIGPAWSNTSSGVRGTGPGTTELQLKSGIWTNKNAITLHNGATAYTSLAANQCTYVGSIYMDTTNGQVSCHVSAAQSRKWGIWNAYNRKKIILKVSETTGNWPYSTNTWRPSNGSTANSATVFSGLLEEYFLIKFNQQCALGNVAGSTVYAQNGIGINITSSTSGLVGVIQQSDSSNFGAHGISGILVAEYFKPPALGVQTVYALELSSGTNTYFGTEPDMVLSVEYEG